MSRTFQVCKLNQNRCLRIKYRRYQNLQRGKTQILRFAHTAAIENFEINKLEMLKADFLAAM